MSLLFVGQHLGPLAPSGVAYRANGESVLRLIDFANDSITLNEVTTLPVSADRVRCVPLTAFFERFIFVLADHVAGGRRREEGRMLVFSSMLS